MLAVVSGQRSLGTSGIRATSMKVCAPPALLYTARDRNHPLQRLWDAELIPPSAAVGVQKASSSEAKTKLNTLFCFFFCILHEMSQHCFSRSQIIKIIFSVSLFCCKTRLGEKKNRNVYLFCNFLYILGIAVNVAVKVPLSRTTIYWLAQNVIKRSNVAKSMRRLREYL